MVIFHSYVKLPEGRRVISTWTFEILAMLGTNQLGAHQASWVFQDASYSILAVSRVPQLPSSWYVTLVDSSQFFVGSYGFQSYGPANALAFLMFRFWCPCIWDHLSISHLCTNSGVYPRVRSLFLMGSISMDSNLMLSLYIYISALYTHMISSTRYPISNIYCLLMMIFF